MHDAYRAARRRHNYKIDRRRRVLLCSVLVVRTMTLITAYHRTQRRDDEKSQGRFNENRRVVSIDRQFLLSSESAKECLLRCHCLPAVCYIKMKILVPGSIFCGLCSSDAKWLRTLRRSQPVEPTKTVRQPVSCYGLNLYSHHYSP